MELMRGSAATNAVLFGLLAAVHAAFLAAISGYADVPDWLFLFRLALNVLLSLGIMLFASAMTSACRRGAAPARMEESSEILLIGAVLLLVAVILRTVLYGVPLTGFDGIQPYSFSLLMHGVAETFVANLSLMFDFALAFLIWNAASAFEGLARRAAQVALLPALINVLAGMYEMLALAANQVIAAGGYTLVPWPDHAVWTGLSIVVCASMAALFAGLAVQDDRP